MAGEYYLLIETYWCTQEHSYTISSYSDVTVELEQVDQDEEELGFDDILS